MHMRILPMRVLMDTRCFIMAATEGWAAIPKRAQRLLQNTEVERVLSTVSMAEVAIKTSINGLNMPEGRLRTAIRDMRVHVIPFTAAHISELFALPLHHREPFDRMIIATALAEQIPLLGGDEKFPLYRPQGLSIVWR